MRLIRLSVFILAFVAIMVMSCSSVDAQQTFEEQFSVSYVDSAVMAVAEGDTRRLERWTDAIESVRNDSDLICIANCLRSCDAVSNGHLQNHSFFSEAIARFSGRTDSLALYGLTVAYASNGYFELLTSRTPSDKSFVRAEKYAHDLNDSYLELSVAILRTKLYIRSRRFVEAAYSIRIVLNDAQNRYPDIYLWAQINLMRTYSAISVWSMVNEISNEIEQTGYYAINPIYSRAYYCAMAVNAVRAGRSAEANVYSWRACQSAAKCQYSRSEAWRVSIVRALCLLVDGKYEKAKQIADSCSAYIDVIPKNTIDPFFSRHNLRLIEAQIAMALGNSKEAWALLNSWNFPSEIFEFDDFSRRYYKLVEDLAVESGDYRLALTSVQKADSVHRNALLLGARIRSKDMEMSLRTDTVFSQQRLELLSGQNELSSHRRYLTYIGVSLLIIVLLCVASYLVKVQLENKRRQERDVEFNKKLSAEVNRQIDEFEEQNKLLIKRNLDMAASQSYARRLQRGILPNVNRLVKMGLTNSFIIRSSSDTVSGCFYWYRKSGGKIYICCAVSDWGGGMAGAMMSMVGLTLINDAVSRSLDYSKASQLLDVVNSGFSSHLPDSRLRRGLSMSIAVVNTEDRTVCVSCAASGAAVYCNGSIITVPAAKLKVGEGFSLGSTLSDVEFSYKAGDSVFLYSNSLPRILNAKGEQMGDENFCNVLARAAKLPTKLHHDAILNEILHWTLPRPFDDDVLLVGFSLP